MLLVLCLWIAHSLPLAGFHKFICGSLSFLKKEKKGEPWTMMCYVMMLSQY